MADAIIDGNGSGFKVSVTSDNKLKVESSFASGSNAGSVNVYDWTTNLIHRIDYEGEFQPIYMGLAQPGANTGSASWQIRKNTISGNMVIAVLFGSGNTNFDKVWDSRSGASEAYS